MEFEQRRLLDPNEIKVLQIDRKWYFDQICSRFSQSFIRKETAQLLHCLEYDEIINFMSGNDFNKSSLKDCLKLGLSCSQNNAEFVLLKASVDCVLKLVASTAGKVEFLSQVSFQLITRVM